MSFRTSLLVLITSVALLGAGCWGAQPSSEQASVVSPSSTVSDVEPPMPVAEPKRWDRTETPTGIKFTVPKGYWVAVIENTRTHYLIPGEPPEPGSPDPRPEAVPRAVASIADLQNDPVSFPTWEGFELTAAQFSCTTGTTPEDFTVCRDTPKSVTTGRTEGDFPYRKFSLPRVLQSTGAARGTQTFISVQFGDGSNDGMLVAILDDRHAATILEFTKSLRR